MMIDVGNDEAYEVLCTSYSGNDFDSDSAEDMD
jgi:hypothetical protein